MRQGRYLLSSGVSLAGGEGVGVGDTGGEVIKDLESDG